MAGNGRRCRSRRDDAADVAQTVKVGALSPQHLMSRPASGWLTALLKLGATEGGSGRSPIECGSGCRWAHTEPWLPNARQRASESRWRVTAQIGQPQVCRANPEPVFGPRWLTRKGHHVEVLGRILGPLLGQRRHTTGEGPLGRSVQPGRHPGSVSR
jgi:hypothetical protein